MSRRHDRPTFAEMVRQPTWSEQEVSTTGRHAVRPGTYNRAGELFDPEGAPLRKVRDDVTADDARRLLRIERPRPEDVPHVRTDPVDERTITVKRHRGVGVRSGVDPVRAPHPVG